jgi:hypothetical protein
MYRTALLRPRPRAIEFVDSGNKTPIVRLTSVDEDERMQRIKAEIVATAAEAFAAAQFARFGYNVSVQYDSTEPECVLIVAVGGRMLRISAKGSTDGCWNLAQFPRSDLSTANRATCHDAADLWLAGHKAGTAICLVQLEDVAADTLPRAYLAWPLEVAARLKTAPGGCRDMILWERYIRDPNIAGAGTVERLLDEWTMTRERIEGFMNAGS